MRNKLRIKGLVIGISVIFLNWYINKNRIKIINN